MESLLLTLVIILAILIVVVLLIPDRLEHRALRNQQQREAIAADAAALTAETDTLQQSLAPYAACQSAVYSAKAQEIGTRLTQLQSEQQTMARQIAALRLPVIPRLPLPIQHFLMAPGDATAVFSDANRLSRMARAVNEAGGSLASVRAALADLDAIPADLRAESQSLLRRLDALVAALRVEQRAGIEDLDTLEQGLVAQQTTVAELEAQFHTRTPLPQLDAGAQGLETATRTTAALETQLNELNRARLQLDRRIQETADELDEVQVNAKGGAAVDTGDPADTGPVSASGRLAQRSRPGCPPPARFRAG